MSLLGYALHGMSAWRLLLCLWLLPSLQLLIFLSAGSENEER